MNTKQMLKEKKEFKKIFDNMNYHYRCILREYHDFHYNKNFYCDKSDKSNVFIFFRTIIKYMIADNKNIKDFDEFYFKLVINHKLFDDYGFFDN